MALFKSINSYFDSKILEYLSLLFFKENLYIAKIFRRRLWAKIDRPN